MEIRLITALAFLMITGCGPQGYEPPKWDPVSLSSVQSELEFETGFFDGERSTEIFQVLTGETGHALMSFIVTPLLVPYLEKSQVGEGEADEFATVEGALGQAAAWIRVSCPGADFETPIKDFSQGYLQLDGSNLVYGDVSDVSGVLNLLMRFNECALGPYQVKGRLPAMVDVDNGIVALRSDLEFIEEGVVTQLNAPMIFDGDGLSFAITTENVKFLITLHGYEEDGIRYSVQASNGTFQCELTQESTLDCMSPTGTVISSRLGYSD